VLRRHRAEKAEIGIALVSDGIMARLHRRHLGKRGPTDVLAFDLAAGHEQGGGVEGEIVISVETANREAALRGHSTLSEVTLYAVHGLLHLMGYNDHGRIEAAKMHGMEDDILREVGLVPAYGNGEGPRPRGRRPSPPRRIRVKR